MHSAMTVWLNLAIGPAYDAVGRKMPTTILFLITTTGEFLVPFVTTYNPGFVIVSFL